MADFDQRTNWLRSPPRVKLEHAAIDVGLGKTLVADRFQVFADACQTRETTPAAIADALTTRRRVPGRSLLVELLRDLDTGACSVLERGVAALLERRGWPGPFLRCPECA
jgi:hypothetical protein